MLKINSKKKRALVQEEKRKEIIVCDPIFVTACKRADLPKETCVFVPVYVGVSAGSVECCTASCHTSETGSLRWGERQCRSFKRPRS